MLIIKEYIYNWFLRLIFNLVSQVENLFLIFFYFVWEMNFKLWLSFVYNFLYVSIKYAKLTFINIMRSWNCVICVLSFWLIQRLRSARLAGDWSDLQLWSMSAVIERGKFEFLNLVIVKCGVIFVVSAIWVILENWGFVVFWNFWQFMLLTFH